MLKSAVKTALAKLPFSLRYEIFFQAAQTLGVRGYLVDGEYGQFIGPLRDQAVIKSYLRDATWSNNILSIVSGFFVGQRGGTFIDVGANIGLISAPVSRLPGISCISFEPDPQNFALLKSNLAGNSVDRSVRVINAAVADKPGTMRFARSEFNCGDHRLSPDGELAVEVTTLDSLQVPPGPLAVKIDTQGAEPLVFAGGARVLAEAGLIIAEFWPWGMRRMGLEPGPILHFVRQHGCSGHLLHHDETPGEPVLSSADLVQRLQAIADDGGINAQADLVLRRPTPAA